jgi:hypothetical protein
MRPEALELWVVAVSFRRALEHSSCEQAFSPEGNQSFGVEILRMKRPEAHRAPNGLTGQLWYAGVGARVMRYASAVSTNK